MEENVMSVLHDILDRWELMYYTGTGSRVGNKQFVEDFSLIELYVIKMIATHGGMMPLGEARARLKIPNSTLSSLVKRLVSNHIIEKVPSLEDGRAFDLKLLEKGRRINDAHYMLDVDVARNFVSRISREDAEAFVRIARQATRQSLVSRELSETCRRKGK